MPSLKNPRWELFLRNRAEGMAISKAYMLAGFNVANKQVAFSAGSRLLRNVHIQARLRELIDERAEKVVVTRESLAAEIDDAAEQASELDQPSVRIQAAMAKAKLFGLEAPSKNVNVNLSGTFNQMTDDELRYELASLVNAVRAATDKPLLELPGPKKDEAKH
jgi:hypothetical protein